MQAFIQSQFIAWQEDCSKNGLSGASSSSSSSADDNLVFALTDCEDEQTLKTCIREKVLPSLVEATRRAVTTTSSSSSSSSSASPVVRSEQNIASLCHAACEDLCRRLCAPHQLRSLPAEVFRSDHAATTTTVPDREASQGVGIRVKFRYFETPLRAIERDKPEPPSKVVSDDEDFSDDSPGFGLSMDIVDRLGFRVTENQGVTAVKPGLDVIIGVDALWTYGLSEEEIENLEELNLHDGAMLRVLRIVQDEPPDAEEEEIRIPSNLKGAEVLNAEPDNRLREYLADQQERGGSMRMEVDEEAVAINGAEMINHHDTTTAPATENPEKDLSPNFSIESRQQRGRRRRKKSEDDEDSPMGDAAESTADGNCSNNTGSGSGKISKPNTRHGFSKSPRAAIPAQDLARLEAKFNPSSPLSTGGYEYKSHTADIIFHAWGRSLKDAFEHVAVCLFSYMTELSSVNATESIELFAEGRNLRDLLYHFLDELLFSFLTEMFVCKYVEVFLLDETKSDIFEDESTNINPWKVRIRGYGESFRPVSEGGKHAQGTEIKAITMHEMRIIDVREKAEGGVGGESGGVETTNMVDEEGVARLPAVAAGSSVPAASVNAATAPPVELYVLVDI
ncbi:unnamed protein product [Amoebophrya sp. A120]|nr:unnamed protein product [Amoebophrya sp. A120]|eukprot:GSA120T00023547001.1